MTFCTFETSSLLEKGKVVQQTGSSVEYNTSTSQNRIVGIISDSYQDPDSLKYYAKVHLGGGVCYGIISSDWDGLWSPLTVDGDKIKAAGGDDQFHGYLIPQLPPVSALAGESVAIYWRGVI